MNWIVDYVNGWQATLGEMPPASGRRAMRLVREFAERPANVHFEIVFQYYLLLSAEPLKEWRIVVVLDDPFLRVLGAVRYPV